MAKLTARQDMFCREYLIDLNATQAAIRAGYSEKTANRIGHENLTKLDIVSRIKELKEEREKETKINAQWVLQRAVELHNLCVKAEEYNAANKSLEIVGKHVNIQAFKEKSEVEHKGRIETIEIKYL